MTYNTVIVGAGLAGLHCALRLKERFPKSKIAIYELYNYVGGRVVTYHPREFPSVHWENGAGRIHDSHILTKRYVWRYGLHLLKIPPTAQWRSASGQAPDTWNGIATILLHTFGNLPPTVLASKTVAELLELVHGETYATTLLNRFPYRAEVYSMRADLAFQSLSKEMGTSNDFYVVEEGLSEMVKAMRKELEERGVEFFFGHRLSAVNEDTPTTLKFKTEKGSATVRADKVILALHSDALKQVNPFQNLPMLKHLNMEPLLRTYHIYPTRGQKAWFHDIPKTITDSPLRYIIPINPAEGTIMSSYTDAQDTKHWMRILNKKGDRGLGAEILKETRALFSDHKIPEPLFFKAHPWKEGCTYWLPGRYDPATVSKKIMRPLPFRWPEVYVCGESYSLRQAWMEGALEHAEEMLKTYFIKED